MKHDRDSRIYLGIGPLGAILLGVLLMPLRGLAPAANFAYAFVALTIVIGELGGRTAAVATALASALSLDFFLTEPYLHLAIRDKQDLIAFFGLAACGLLAAAFASVHGRSTRALSRQQLELLRTTVAELPQSGPLASRLERILVAARQSFPLAAAVVRGPGDELLAATAGAGTRPLPGAELEPERLSVPAPAGSASGGPGAPLPAEGARVALVVGQRRVGWLDLYGDGSAASLESRQALAAVARAMAALLAAAER